jgi:anti-sigma factor RsiW
MGEPVRVPSLEDFGYRLVGSRVLPDTDGPAAQFVFADQAGKKVSLYVRGEQADKILSMRWPMICRCFTGMIPTDPMRWSRGWMTSAGASRF